MCLAKVLFTWIPGLKGLVGNAKADKLTRGGSASYELPKASVETPMGVVKGDQIVSFIIRVQMGEDWTLKYEYDHIVSSTYKTQD